MTPIVSIISYYLLSYFHFTCQHLYVSQKTEISIWKYFQYLFFLFSLADQEYTKYPSNAYI